MAKKWIDALKEWNSQKGNGGAWCIPKKGSKEYDKVSAIMKGERPAPPPAPVKTKPMTRSAYKKAVQKSKKNLYAQLKKIGSSAGVDIDPDMM